MEEMSFVKACKAFFESEPFGRKVEISEFKALTRNDRIEMREMLVEQGFNVTPIPDLNTPVE